MKIRKNCILLLFMIPCVSFSKTLESKISSVALFKNGYAYITHKVNIPQVGKYTIAPVFRPVHGTFWFSENENIEVRMKMQDVETDNFPGDHDIQTSLSGSELVVYLKDRENPIRGKVIKSGKDITNVGWDQMLNPRSPYSSSIASAVSSFLTIKNKQGIYSIDRSQIAYFQIVQLAKRTIKKPVLILNAKNNKKSPLIFRYLTKGLSWAPSYRIDMSDSKKLTIEQKAVIKNELGNIIDAQVYVISGFPSVQFAHVESPLSIQTSWADFFRQLSQKPSTMSNITMNVVSQAARISDVTASGSFDSQAEGGKDIHYQFIGKLTLNKNESFSQSIASASANYERIVEWNIPETHQANGRYIRHQDQKLQDDIWDTLHFQNPLPFPMTTGAVVIEAKNKFRGQRMTHWTGKNETASISITKALSIRVKSSEQEDAASRKSITIAGSSYQKTKIKGLLQISNQRNIPVKMIVHRKFYGDLIKADEKPDIKHLADGAWSVNKRNQLTWQINLKRGEKKLLTYQYSIFIN